MSKNFNANIGNSVVFVKGIKKHVVLVVGKVETVRIELTLAGLQSATLTTLVTSPYRTHAGTRTPTKCLEGICAIRYTTQACVLPARLELASYGSKPLILSIELREHLWLK